jgi:hypothetical protein
MTAERVFQIAVIGLFVFSAAFVSMLIPTP